MHPLVRKQNRRNKKVGKESLSYSQFTATLISKLKKLANKITQFLLSLIIKIVWLSGGRCYLLHCNRRFYFTVVTFYSCG